MKKMEFYLTTTPDFNINISEVVGKIEFLDTTLGNTFIDMLNKGILFSIKPFGVGEFNDNGEFTNFNLIGFTIHNEK